VAIAVREQTRGMKTMLVGSMIGLGTLAVAAYWFGHREAAVQVAELTKLMQQSDSAAKYLQAHTRIGDTSFANALTRQTDSLRRRVQETARRGNESEIAALKAEIEKMRVSQQGMSALDFSDIAKKNDNAIAFLMTKLDDTLYGGTAFTINKSGLMVTNRHNVRSATGAQTTLLQVQFANTKGMLPARVIKVSEDSTDLALIQVIVPGNYPVVAGIVGSGTIPVGAPIVTMGFPKSLELAQAGDTAKTTLSAGSVSKHLPTLLQLDTWGTHGLSGAPVFNINGQVVGVVWGGPADAQAKVVYAVPSDKLVAFLGEYGKEIIR
jgi:S1-C subfamily serine protease